MRFAIVLVTAVLGIAPSASAQIVQERVDLDVVRRIREEGLQRSQIPALAHSNSRWASNVRHRSIGILPVSRVLSAARFNA